MFKSDSRVNAGRSQVKLNTFMLFVAPGRIHAD
jgi:hypothetical protein